MEVISEKDWDIVHEIMGMIQSKLGGIMQADGEGFYNEQGHFILWQLSYDVSGEHPVAVLDKNGKRIPYTIELSNKEAVTHFKEGNPPV